MLLKLMRSIVKQLGGAANGIREVSWSGACLGTREVDIYSIERRKHSVLVSGVHSQCATEAGTQHEMENRPSSYHLITGNSSHCAEEITAAYECLLPIYVSMMVRRETVCYGTLTSVLSAGLSSLFSETTHTEQRGHTPVLMKMEKLIAILTLKHSIMNGSL